MPSSGHSRHDCGPYPLLRLLRQTPSGRSYLSRVPGEGQALLLKRFEPEDQTRFVRQLALMPGLAGPHLARLRAAGHDGSRPFLVCEAVEGMLLGEWLARRAQPAEVAVEVLRQICSVLRRLHRRGLLHGELDERCCVVQVDSAGSLRLRLLDLGSVGAPLIPGGAVLCQAAYLGPELSGLADLPVDGRADLYALGVLAYQILTGERPFRAPQRLSLIHEQLSSRPSFEQPIWRQLPDGLRLLVERLLAKDPAQRYSHVQSLLEDLHCLALPGPPLKELDSGRCLSLPPALVGHDALLKSLEQRWMQPDCRQLALLGPADAGKTALAQELGDRLGGQGTLFVELPEGARPLWSQALDSLALAAHSLPADRRARLATRWQQRALELHAEILGLCPALADLLGIERPEDKESSSETDTVRGLIVPPGLLDKPAESEARALRGKLAQLFCTMLLDASPMLLCIDDIHLRKGEDLAFLSLCQAELRQTSTPRFLLFLVGRSLPTGLHCETCWPLPELAPGPLRKLARAWLGDARLSEVQLGAVVAEAASRPGCLPGLLRRELGRAGNAVSSELATETLSAAAVLGDNFEHAQLEVLLKAGPYVWDGAESLAAQLQAAADSGLLRQTGDRWSFAGPELRQRCLDLLDPRLRAELHRLAADVLEGAGASALQLYEHLRQAGETRRALRYALPAAQGLRDGGAFAQAARLLAGSRALANTLEGRASWASGLLEREGDAWLLADEAARAEACYRQALDERAPDLVERARLLCRCAETRLRRGQLRSAEEAFAEAWLLVGPRPEAPPERRSLPLLVQILQGRAWCGFFIDARAACRDLLQLLRLLRRNPQLPVPAQICATVAIFAAERGGLRTARRWLHAAREATQRCQEPTRGTIPLAEGLLAFAEGDLDRARQTLSQAERCLAGEGQHWERRQALLCLARTAMLQGDDASAALLGRRLREAAGASGDVQGRGCFALLEAELMAAGHNFDGSISAGVQAVASLQRSGDRRSEARAALLLAEAWLRKGRLGRAAEVSRQAVELHRAGRFAGTWALRLRLLQVEIELGFAAEVQRARADHQPFLSRAAAGLAEVLRRSGPAEIRSQALRLRGLVHAIEGALDAASQDLRQALELARRAGLQHVADGARDALEQLGRTGRVTPREEGTAKTRAVPLLDEEARAERDLAHLVQVAAILGSCDSRDALIERGLVAALKALLADAALLLGLRADGSPFLEAAFDSRGQSLAVEHLAWDRGVVAAVLASGRARAEHLPAAPEALSTRSVLCAPLGVAGKVEGALYMDCQLVRRSFSSADLRLLQAIASLLGSGLLLVASLEELVRVNRELDGRVRERTARLEQVFAEREAIWAQVVRLEKASSQLQLAAGLSHDLNSPVGALGSLAESLLELAAEPEPDFPELVRDVASTMRQAAGRCSELIGSLRQLGRGVEGEARHFDLKLVVEQGMKLLEHRLRGRWHALELASCTVHAVLAEAHQVVLNLLDNALDATEGRGPIEIELRRCDRHALFRVRNGGRPIPADLEQRVFSPGETSAPGKHLGLGLSIVRRLVEKHGGSVELVAEAASTELRILWPLATAVGAEG